MRSWAFGVGARLSQSFPLIIIFAGMPTSGDSSLAPSLANGSETGTHNLESLGGFFLSSSTAGYLLPVATGLFLVGG